jgi:hypothetical protein
MRAVLREEAGRSIFLDIVLAVLILAAGYQFFLKDRNKAPTPSSPAPITGQADTPPQTDPAPTIVTGGRSATTTETGGPPPVAEQTESVSPEASPAETTRVEAPQPAARPPSRDRGRSDPFPTASRQVPLLLVSQLAPNNLRMYSATPGALFYGDIVVTHEPSGKGQVTTDGPYGDSVVSSLYNAAVVAGYAVGYDPRFLHVQLNGRTRAGVAINIEGPSATAIMTVAIASALLGDSIRSDICMSGTITGDLRIGRVGGLSDKIGACRQGNYREMIIPYGQSSMELSLKSMSGEIKLTEVNTFADAYEAATGRSLRKL